LCCSNCGSTLRIFFRGDCAYAQFSAAKETRQRSLGAIIPTAVVALINVETDDPVMFGDDADIPREKEDASDADDLGDQDYEVMFSPRGRTIIVGSLPGIE
jgi:hypothetical protein